MATPCVHECSSVAATCDKFTNPTTNLTSDSTNYKDGFILSLVVATLKLSDVQGGANHNAPFIGTLQGDLPWRNI